MTQRYTYQLINGRYLDGQSRWLKVPVDLMKVGDNTIAIPPSTEFTLNGPVIILDDGTVMRFDELPAHYLGKTLCEEGVKLLAEVAIPHDSVNIMWKSPRRVVAPGPEYQRILKMMMPKGQEVPKEFKEKLKNAEN